MIIRNGVRVPASEIKRINKPITFELASDYRGGTGKKTNGNKVPIQNVYMTIPSVYVWNDPKTGENLEMRYARAETPQTTQLNGTVTTRWDPHKIKFINGILRCENTDSDLYFWLMNHPNMKDNAVTKKKRVIFYVVDPDREAVLENEGRLATYQALSVIYGENAKEIAEQRRILAGLNLGENLDDLSNDQVSARLAKEAEKNPKKFLKDITSAQLSTQTLISEAILKEVITLSSNLDKWYWGNKVGESSSRLLVSVPQGRKHDEFLREFLLRTDNSGVLNEIAIILNGGQKPAEKKAEFVPPQIKATKEEAASGNPNPENVDTLTRVELERKALMCGAIKSRSGLHKIKDDTLRKMIKEKLSDPVIA